MAAPDTVVGGGEGGKSQPMGAAGGHHVGRGRGAGGYGTAATASGLREAGGANIRKCVSGCLQGRTRPFRRRCRGNEGRGLVLPAEAGPSLPFPLRPPGLQRDRPGDRTSPGSDGPLGAGPAPGSRQPPAPAQGGDAGMESGPEGRALLPKTGLCCVCNRMRTERLFVSS